MELLGENSENEILLYSTGCPKCMVLKNKLKSKNILFKEINDRDEMVKNNIAKVPMLKINTEILDFVAANDWVNSQNAETTLI